MSIARVLADPKTPGQPLAQPGEILTAERLWQLHRSGVYDLWVNDLGLEFFDDLCSASRTSREHASRRLRESFLYFCRRHAPRGVQRGRRRAAGGAVSW